MITVKKNPKVLYENIEHEHAMKQNLIKYIILIKLLLNIIILYMYKYIKYSFIFLIIL